jgi:hypothetical protein
MSVRMAVGASATPSDPPAKARRMLSAKSCRPIRPREAPRASLVLISRSGPIRARETVRQHLSRPGRAESLCLRIAPTAAG